MGLIRDALGSALGGNDVNNGFGGGPRLPFGRGFGSRSQSSWSQSPSPRQGYGSSYADDRDSYPSGQMQGRGGRAPRSRDPGYDFGGRPSRQDYPTMDPYPDRRYQDQYPPPPRYEPAASDERSWNQEQSYGDRSYGDRSYNDRSYNDRSYNDMANSRDMGYSRNGGFRPLALPQISYGDGQPFLRGYSDELSQYGISAREFIQVLDAINTAIIPSPENQIFQKGANIAGWFLPGAAGIGLMVGQIGVGLGTAVGHSSMLARTLSDVNIRLFVPNGLEICIGKTTDVDAEVGINSASGRSNSAYGASPEERQAYYGNLVAPLSQVLPPLQKSGRSDPIAMLGRGLASRDNQKKIEKAEKDMAKSKNKNLDSLEGGLKWLMVRRASADALAYWQKTLLQSNDAIQQEQARTSSQGGYNRR